MAPETILDATFRREYRAQRRSSARERVRRADHSSELRNAVRGRRERETDTSFSTRSAFQRSR
jgi:hypothetical protein